MSHDLDIADVTPAEPTVDAPGRTRPRLLILATLVGVAGIVLGLVMGLLVPAMTASSTTSADAKAAAARATDFAIGYNTYDAADLADYQQRMKALMTAEYHKEFVTVTDSIFPSLKEKKQVSADAEVLSTGVDSVDGDSASVLVAVNAVLTNSENTAGVLTYYRWSVQLVRVGDDWRVEQFIPVAAGAASTSDPNATPAPEATSPSPEVGQ